MFESRTRERKMLTRHMFFVFLLFACIASLSHCLSTVSVRDACKVTRYPKLCIQSLSPSSNTTRKTHSGWTRAAVSVTLREAKSVTTYLARLRRSNKSTEAGVDFGALSDCVDLLQEGVDELHESLRLMRELSVVNFDAEMSDLSTWLSATLTDQDTCLEGLEEAGRGRRKRVGSVRKRVGRVGYLTSNALALVNELASTGLGSGTDP